MNKQDKEINFEISQDVIQKEIVSSLKALNGQFFNIPNLEDYSTKIITLGNSICLRNGKGELLSYILYYNNRTDLFITMVWTNELYRGMGYAKNLLNYLINSCSNEIVLEVNETNPALNLYLLCKFEIKSHNNGIVTMRYNRRLAIMQPYIFPYIGYFHLIESTKKIIFYDDVHFIKQGWINRNRILINNSAYTFSIPLKKLSQNKLINEVEIEASQSNTLKFLRQIELAYKNAPYFEPVYKMIESVVQQEYKNISEMAVNSIEQVYKYLGLNFNWELSSQCCSDSKGMIKEDRLIKITKKNKFNKYVNALGGMELYDKDYFLENGVRLSFVRSKPIIYKQFKEPFISNLSIIDVLMFNNKSLVREFLSKYELV